MDMPVVLTRRSRETELESLGVTGAALGCLLSETAQERHESRVAYARWAAEEYYLAQCSLDRSECSDATLSLAAGAILWADVIGIGGRDGVAGDATARHPAFRSAGKGRKQATDGYAWSAAILAAARSTGTLLTVLTETQCLAVLDSDGGSMLICEELVPLAWRLSILREGLRRAAAVIRLVYSYSGGGGRGGYGAYRHQIGWHPDVPMDTPRESATSWSKLLNDAVAEMPPAEEVQRAY